MEKKKYIYTCKNSSAYHCRRNRDRQTDRQKHRHREERREGKARVGRERMQSNREIKAKRTKRKIKRKRAKKRQSARGGQKPIRIVKMKLQRFLLYSERVISSCLPRTRCSVQFRLMLYPLQFLLS